MLVELVKTILLAGVDVPILIFPAVETYIVVKPHNSSAFPMKYNTHCVPPGKVMLVVLELGNENRCFTNLLFNTVKKDYKF